MELNSEALAKAMSRKPVEGCTKGPWFLVNSEHGWQLWASHGKTGSMMIAQFPAAGFDELNAGLASLSPDLQDENQVLQAAVRDAMASLHQSVAMLTKVEATLLNNEHDKLPVLGPFIYDSRMRSLQTLSLMPTEGQSE